jgi:protein gp37
VSDTTIEWTDATWNPTTGCDRISRGCDNCYALNMSRRLKAMGQAKYQTDGNPATSGPGFGLAVHPDTLAEPLRWRKPRTVFVNSMSDLGHARVPRAFLAQVWAVMALTPQHTYQILTKRPERLARVLTDEFRRVVRHLNGQHATVGGIVQWPLANVWVGASVEDADVLHRIDALRRIPAAVRFVSAEPLLGPLDDIDLTGIDWLIAGGESGPGARPMDLDWVRGLRDRCAESGTALFVKQLGSHWEAAAGRRGKGGDMQYWPAGLRIREYPDAPGAEVAW